MAGPHAVVEAPLHVNRADPGERAVGRRVGHRDGLAVVGIGREGRAGGRGLAVVRDPHVLDFGFVDIAQRVGRLDVVVEEFVAKIRQRGVVDLGEVVVGNDRVGPEGRIENEVVDLSVGGGGIEGRAGLGEDTLGHGDGHPSADFVAARVSLVLVGVERIGAVLVEADLEFHVALGDPVDVIGVGPDVEPRGHLFEVAAVVEVRLSVEPSESIPAGIVGEPLGLEHGGTDLVLCLAGRGHEALQFVDGVLGGEGGFDFVVVAKAAVIVETGVEALEVDVPGEFDVVGPRPGTVPIVGMRNLPLVDHVVAAVFFVEHLLGGLEPVGAGHERGVAEEFQREARRFHVDLRAGMRGFAAVGHGGHGRLDPFQKIR